MKLIKYLLVCSIGALAFSSCSKDYLETSPTDAVGDAVAEGTVPGVLGLVNGLHNMMYSYEFGQFFGAGIPSLNIQLDMLGDDVINTRPSYYMGVYRWTDHRYRQEGENINYKAWDSLYTLILHANTAINSVKNKLSSSDRDNDEVKYAYGEALAFRAYAYHYLVQLFAKRYDPATASKDLGVILRTDENFTQQYSPAPRATIAAVYDQIEADLKQALELLKPLEAKTTRNHLNYAIVSGIAARVALCKGDYTQAIAYAKEAIARPSSKLDAASLLEGFNDYTAPEWMWGYRQSETQNYYYAGFYAHYSYNYAGHNRSFRFAVNRSLYNQLGDKDVRRKWWVCLDRGEQAPSDASSEYFLVHANGTPLWEITGQCIKFKSKNKTSTFGDVILMRIAEMYYILAEAQARSGDEAAARKTLFDIVKTRDEDFTEPTESGNDLINKILLHKRMDLVFEGVRFFDMKRLGTPPNRMGAANFDILGSYTGLGGGANAKASALGRNQGNMAKEIPTTADDPRWQFIIPYQEIRGNNLCEQNP